MRKAIKAAIRAFFRELAYQRRVAALKRAPDPFGVKK
jgi:hypothetical protein